MISRIRKINSTMFFTKRIDCETARIYTPDGTESAWYYNHHTFMTKFKGKFYAVYSSGNRNEDDCRQRIMMATSDNFTDWDVKVFQDSRWGNHSDMVLYCMGIYTDGETLSVMFDSWEFNEDGLCKNDDGSFRRPEAGKGSLSYRKGPYITQSTDGVNWSEPVIMGGNIDGTLYAGNHSPFMTKTGRIIWPGFASLAYTDDPTLRSGWTGVKTPLAESEMKFPLTESTVLENADGTLVCLSRMGRRANTIGAAVSTDGGLTWSDTYRTGFVNSDSKFQFGTLPDGRYYYIGNVDTDRSSVVLMVSEDGINFDERYDIKDDGYSFLKEGLYKGGIYGYPTTFVDEEYMYVIYSLYKESVEVIRFPLSEINARKAGRALPNSKLIERIRSMDKFPSVKIRPTVEKRRIYTPDGTEDAWYYSHHPFITKFKGRFYATYSSAFRNEDDLRQRIMLATSDNFDDWDVRVLVDSMFGENSYLTLYATGLHNDGETLTVYFTAYEYLPETIRKNEDGTDLRPEEKFSKRIRHTPRYIQTTDGVTWTEPKFVDGNFTCGELYCGNVSPVRLKSGKLIWPGFCSMAVSDGDPLGYWNGKMMKMAEGEVLPHDMTESALFQHADGAVFLLGRSGGGRSVCAASDDDGKTWTDLYSTMISDHGAKFELGTMPDGRYFLLGNPDHKRSAAVLALSEDGSSFDKWYILSDEPYVNAKEGMYKGGIYGYPTSYFDGEYMYVIYSLLKESVEILRVKLSELT